MVPTMSRSFAFCVLHAGLLLTAGCNGEQKAPTSSSSASSTELVAVDFVFPVSASVQEFEEFTGRTTAMETIELRARVSGYLDEVKFAEGARVEAGAALFKIDPRPFVAEKTRTSAAVSQIEARKERLAIQERRARQLLEKKAGSQDEYDTARYDLDEATAALAEAKALEEIANLDVTFTTVTSPISGRIGRRMVDVGNLVTADQTILATLVSDESLYVYFDMDERTFLKLRRMKSRKDASADSGSPMDVNLEVDIALADSEKFDRKGEVTFFDNQLDSATGTLRVRATVPNTDGVLSPGLFVRVRYPVGEAEQLLTIREEALASDQGKPYVFVVGQNDKGQVAAIRRNVELGAMVEVEGPVELGVLKAERRSIRCVTRADDRPITGEDQPIVKEDRIIVSGLQRLRKSGMHVEPTLSDDASTKESSPEPAEP